MAYATMRRLAGSRPPGKGVVPTGDSGGNGRAYPQLTLWAICCAYGIGVVGLGSVPGHLQRPVGDEHVGGVFANVDCGPIHLGRRTGEGGCPYAGRAIGGGMERTSVGGKHRRAVLVQIWA